MLVSWQKKIILVACKENQLETYIDPKMADYQIIPSNHPILNAYIDHYMYVSGGGHISSKKIFPRAGISMIFDFTAPFYFGNKRFFKALSGLQNHPFTYASQEKRADHLVVQFSPYGLSRFIDIPMNELTDQIIEPVIIFGEDIHDLHEQIEKADSLQRRIELLEAFFLERYSPPPQSDTAIFAIADELLVNHDNINFRAVKEQTSLSTRQVERKFKTIVGVDMQTYIRICRFEHAKKILLQNPSLRLTDVGLAAGYYDQPHFSNDFKRITGGVSPGKFDHCMES